MIRTASRFSALFALLMIAVACGVPQTQTVSTQESAPEPITLPAGSSDTTNYYEIKLYYGTDRAETTTFPKAWSYLKRSAHKFNGLRSSSGNVTYGTVTVSVPYSHELGELDEAWLASNNPEKSMVLLSAENKTTTDWIDQIRQDLARVAGRSALIYVHGYNVSFRDAARRCAQLSFDLRFPGVPMFYSWPSLDATHLYTVDEATVEWTIPHLTDFLRNAIGGTEAENVYIIAHSMGARATARALEALSRSDAGLFERVKHVIFAAPDIDADVFKSQILPAFTQHTQTTLYASAGDVPIGTSTIVHRYPRAGAAGESILVSSRLETIDATGIDTSFLGHSYYATTQPLIEDIKGIIAGIPADYRTLLRRSANGKYFEFRPEIIP